MPNNPLIEAFRQIVGSPETGRGLFSPQNIMDALKLTGQQYTGQAPLEPSAGMPGSPVQIPQIDLGRINVQAPQQPQQPQIPTPPMNIASPMENVALAGQQGQQKPQGNGINWQMLMDIGIPALSAIIGTAAPGTLAAASGLSTGYTGAREKQREQEHELQKERTKKEYEITDLTPSERNYKRKQIKDFNESYAKNRSNRRFITEARPLLDKLPSGLGGSISMASKKMFDPNSPILGDWQRVKAILTDTTLLHSMKTKGAISDREMEEFKQAAANDVLISKPRIEAAFDRYEQILDSEDEGKIDSFYQAFGEDPRGKGATEQTLESSQGMDFSTMSDEELRSIANE